MRCGLVGIYTNYRPQEIKGVKFGIIDLIFQGDIHFPTETHEIKIFNSALCAFLIKTLAEHVNPLLNMCCWIDLKQKEPVIQLLEIISVHESKAV